MRIYQLHLEINMHSQGTDSISAYFTKLKFLWSEYYVLVPNPSCELPKSREYSDHMCQLRFLPFLSGLIESYDQARKQILLKGVTPYSESSLCYAYQGCDPTFNLYSCCE